MTSPTTTIVSNAQKTREVRDELGRILTVRRIGALDRLRLLKAAGSELSQNDAWLNMAALAISVVEMDGTPRLTPMTERQVEVAVAELGDCGLRAIADCLSQEDDGALLFDGPPSGNAQGTPT